MSSSSAAAALNSASRGSTGATDRARRTIVTAEIALSVVLICGAVLLFKSLARLQQVDIGATRIDRVITMAVDLPYARYPTGHHLAAFYPLLTDRLRAIPGVEAAAISGDVPLEGTGGEYLRMPGSVDRLPVRFKRADSGYFDTMGLAVRAGRNFTPEDRAGTPYVVVVNETLASRLRDRFGMHDPVGQSVDLPALGFGRDRRSVMTIVGVVRDERVRSDLRAPVEAIAYVPLAQAPKMQVKLAVRAAGGPGAAMPAIRAAVRQLDARLAIADVRTLEEIRDRSLAGVREPVWVIGTFAAVAALLAALGLYGVVAHAMTQRRREIGIHMALGAPRATVVRLVVRSAVAMVGAGLIAGLAAALAVTRLTRSLLFEVSALDPLAFGAAMLAMAVVGLAAALVPAARATRVDPASVLRAEG